MMVMMIGDDDNDDDGDERIELGGVSNLTFILFQKVKQSSSMIPLVLQLAPLKKPPSRINPMQELEIVNKPPVNMHPPQRIMKTLVYTDA